LGTISIDIEARLARFESDIGRAARTLEREMARGAQQASREIARMRQDVERQLESMRRSSSQAAAAIIGVFTVRGAIQFGRELSRINDGYINLQTALKQVTNTQSELTRATKATFDISQRTYASFESTAMLVGRTARALRSAGNDQASALNLSLKFSESINNAFILSGAKAIEAKNALLQLSQGLSSGTLRGDEYRSVAEQGSKVTEVLARNLTEVNGELELANGRLGITTGRLRELAYEGKLTTDLVVKAMVQSFAELSAGVQAIPLTIERAFTLLTNAAELYIGTSENASAVGRTFAESLKFVADNFALIADTIVATSAVILAVFGARTVSAIARYVETLGKARAETLARLRAEELAAAQSLAKARAEQVAAAAALNTAKADLVAAEAAHARMLMDKQVLAVGLSNARVEAERAIQHVANARTTATRIRAENQLAQSIARLNVLTAENAYIQNATAEASNILMAARGRLVAVTADAVIAENALARASATSAAAQAGSAAAASGVGAALRAAGSGALALVGGPLGALVLGLAAAAYAWSELSDAAERSKAWQTDATRNMEGMTKAIHDQIEALRLQGQGFTEEEAKASSAIDMQIATILALQSEMDRMKQYWIDSGVMAFATQMKEAEANLEEAKKKLVNYTDALVELGWAQMEARMNQAALDQTMKDNGQTIKDLNEKIDEQIKKLKLKNIELRDGLRASMIAEALDKAGIASVEAMNEAQREAWKVTLAKIDAVVALTKENKTLQDSERNAASNARREAAARRREQRDFEKDLRQAAKAAKDERDALAALDAFLIDVSQTLSGPMKKALQANVQSWKQYDELIAKFLKDGPPTVDIHEDLALAMRGVYDETERRIEQARRDSVLGGEVLKNLDEELKLLQVAAPLREQAAAMMEAVNDAMDKGIKITPELLAGLEAEIAQRIALKRQLEAEEAARNELQDNLINGANAFFDAWADLTVEGTKGWEDFTDSVISSCKKMVSSIIAQMLKMKLLNPLLNQLFGVNLPTSFGGGATGGPSGAATGASMFGGAGGVANLFSSSWGMFGNQAGWNAASAGGPPSAMGGTAFGSSVFGSSAGQLWGGNTGLGAAGNMLTAAASIYQLHDIRRNGPGGWDGAAQGAMAGASAGTAIMPGIGTAIGAVVGLLVGYFGGGPATLRVSDRERDGRASSRLDDVIGVARDRLPPGTATAVAEGIAEFDNTIAGLLDTMEGGDEQIDRVRAALANWSIRVEGDAANIEAILGKRFDVILSTFTQDIRDFVGATGDIEDRVQRLADAIFLADALESDELVGSFEELADLVEDLADGGESVVDTYARIFGSTVLFEDALEMMGQSTDLGREAFIRFATEISDAAGGLDRAAKLWESYFNTFYSADERAQRDVEEATRNAGEEFEDIGLDFDEYKGAGGLARFRQEFEALMSTLTPAEIAEWLEAGDALGIFNAAVAATGEDVAETADELLRRLAEMAQARAEYAAMVSSIQLGIAEANSSEFVNGLRQIGLQYDEHVSELNRLARAGGLAAAREEDLAAALQLATIRRVQAIKALEQEARALASNLYNPLDALDAQIAAMEQSEQDAASAVRDFGNATREVANQVRDNIDLLLGDLSPLRDREKLQLALEAQRAGRVGPEDVLEIGRRLFASGSDYNSLFDQVMQIGDRRSNDTGGGGGGGGGRAEFQRSAELTALIAQRDKLAEEQRRAERFSQATELAGMVADLSGARGEGYDVVAASLGFTLEQLADDLNFEDIADLTEYLDTLQADSYDLQELASVITAGEAEIARILNNIYESIRNEELKPRAPDTLNPGGKPDNNLAKVEFGTQPEDPIVEELRTQNELLREILNASERSVDELGNVAGELGIRSLADRAAQPRNARNGLAKPIFSNLVK
jgi:tape measure domain-containing protein